MSSTTPSIVRSHSHEHEIDESSSATDSMHCRELSDISINKAAKSTPQPISSKEKTSKADPETDPRTWLCLCEHGILSLCDETPECMCMRYLENNPGHLYTFTKRGDTLYRSWRCDAIERDPDTWGVFTRKDFGKSGMVEAVENMVSVCPSNQSLESLLTLADLRIRQGMELGSAGYMGHLGACGGHRKVFQPTR